MAAHRGGRQDQDMNENEQLSADPQTGLDKIFAALRGIGIRRRTNDTWFRGVCSGFADRLGVDPVIIRVALVVLALLWGVGISIYLVAWALLPNDRDQIVAERALRDGSGGAIVVVVLAGLSLFGGSWWGHDNGWGFPWGLVVAGGLIWWLVQRSSNRPDADQRVSAQWPTAPPAAGPPSTPLSTGAPASASGPLPTTSGPVAQETQEWQQRYTERQQRYEERYAERRIVPKRLRRRSGGGLMALLAIGLSLVTYGSLSWLGEEFHWSGGHRTIAMAGSLAVIGLLLVVLGLAGWRAGFVGFLAVVLAITAWSSAVVPVGIHLGGRVGDATWTPALVTSNANYRLGAGDAVLNLGALPRDGLSEAKLPAYVGIGDLKVVVPEGLTVKVVGHVGLGEILLPSDLGNGQGGTDVARSVVIGDGPTEVVVDAGVGVGQLTVVKE
jgi:phage shock protein PspC (stress-responsive transcriptional regulator)